jgi:fatty acid-binding protein DegV
MSLRIVTDSTTDLPAEIIKKYRILVVPCYINIGDQSYRDGVDVSCAEFSKKLPDVKVQPTTSAPGIDTFIKEYQKLIAEGTNVSSQFIQILRFFI